MKFEVHKYDQRFGVLQEFALKQVKKRELVRVFMVETNNQKTLKIKEHYGERSYRSFHNVQ